MTTEQKIIRAKVGLLELAKQLGNVSQACKVARELVKRTFGTVLLQRDRMCVPSSDCQGRLGVLPDMIEMPVHWLILILCFS